MSRVHYCRLAIEAGPGVEIWLGDDVGHFVQRATGTLDSRLLPGRYTVEFGLGNTRYPVNLAKDSRFTQAEIEAGVGGSALDADFVGELLSRVGYRSLGELCQQATVAPDRGLTSGELQALRRVGLALDGRKTRVDADRARRRLLRFILRTYQTALPTHAVADLLGVSPSTVRHRARARTLLPLPGAGGMRFPAVQFCERGEVPGLRGVLPTLPSGVTTFEVLHWLVTTSVELADEQGRARSPRDYLLATGDAHRVIELAQALRGGESP